jgi:hypothetical protein
MTSQRRGLCLPRSCVQLNAHNGSCRGDAVIVRDIVSSRWDVAQVRHSNIGAFRPWWLRGPVGKRRTPLAHHGQT